MACAKAPFEGAIQFVEPFAPAPLAEAHNALAATYSEERGGNGRSMGIEQFGMLLMGGIALGTLKVYSAAYAAFASSMRDKGVDPVEATDFQVALYLAEEMLKCEISGVGPAKLRMASAAIAWFVGLAGRAAPQGVLCTRILRTAERQLTVQRRPREPVTADALRRVLLFHLVERQPVLQTRMHLTCFLLMFAGLLRYDDMASVLVHKDMVRWVRDSSGRCEGVLVFIPRGKRDQVWEGKWVAIGATHQALCPVALLKELLVFGKYEQSPIEGLDAGPLLRKVSKSRDMQQQLALAVAPIARPIPRLGDAALRLSMRRLFEEAGVYGMYNLHSLRIGGTTAAMAAGCDSALVEAHGRWARGDVAVDIYTRVLETDVRRFFALTRKLWPW